MTSRYGLLYRDVVGLSALPGIVFAWSHAKKPQKKRNRPKKSTSKSAPKHENTFVVRVHSVLA